jgi:hypothetical protein
MNNKVMIVPVAAIFFFTSFKPLQDELFNGESKFSSCRIDLPLLNTKRPKEVAEKTKELKDKELIFLHFNSNTGDVIYGKYFLVTGTDAKNKITSFFLVRADDYENGKQIATQRKYSDKTDRFYTADCFDEVLKNNPEIKQWIIEEGKLP